MEKEKLSKEEDNSKEKEYLDQLQRLQAEFDNYRKRIEKEKTEDSQQNNERLIIGLLNILDNLELALKHTKEEGVEMVYSQLYSLLEKQGLKTIKAEGKFNPELHEALTQEKGENDNLILEELQKGYTLNDKVIRPSKVKISKIQNG